VIPFYNEKKLYIQLLMPKYIYTRKAYTIHIIKTKTT